MISLIKVLNVNIVNFKDIIANFWNDFKIITLE